MVHAGWRMVEAEKSRTRRIFKHDVAITSDQKGIFHSAPFIRRNQEGGTRNPHSSLSTLHPSCYGLLTGNLPRLLLTVLSLHSLGLSFFLFPFLSSFRFSPCPFSSSFTRIRIVWFPSSVASLYLPSLSPCHIFLKSRPCPSCSPLSLFLFYFGRILRH